MVLKNGKHDGSAADSDKVPTPVVIIDQDSDPDATVVEVTFGDRLGALLDTVTRYPSYSLAANEFDSASLHTHALI